MKSTMGYLADVFALLLIAGVAMGAGPKSIFDDDWVPPKSETPKPIVIKPPTPAPVEPVKPDATVPVPKDPTPVPPTPAQRRPIPTKTEQAAVRKVLKEVFAAQLVDRTATGRLKLTQALIAQADKSADAPVDQFVLLAAAIDAGTEAASLQLAYDAADRMGKDFDVDRMAVKLDSTTRLANKPAADRVAENVRVGLALVDELAAADDFAAAARACTSLIPIATADPALRAQVQKRQRELTAARDAAEKVTAHVEKLKNSPEDPTANSEVGKYLCFVKNDWKNGLPALALGGDSSLKALAARDLAGPTTAQTQAAMGDAWWDLAQATTGPNKAAIQSRAVKWYHRASDDLKGLAKAKVEMRLAEAAKSGGAVTAKVSGGTKRPINLLRLVDPQRDKVNAKWLMSAKGLTCDNQGEARLAVPYEPPDEYDYHVAFTRNEGTSTVHVMFGRNGNVVSLAFWGDKFNWGLNCVDGKWRGGNESTGGNDTPFKNGQRYDAVVQVRKDSVTAFLDGKQIFTLKSDFSNLKEFGTWELRGAMLGVAAHQNSATFSAIEIIEVSGTGKPTVPAATR